MKTTSNGIHPQNIKTVIDQQPQSGVDRSQNLNLSYDDKIAQMKTTSNGKQPQNFKEWNIVVCLKKVLFNFSDTHKNKSKSLYKT
jgi:hypothetical protein